MSPVLHLSSTRISPVSQILALLETLHSAIPVTVPSYSPLKCSMTGATHVPHLNPTSCLESNPDRHLDANLILSSEPCITPYPSQQSVKSHQSGATDPNLTSRLQPELDVPKGKTSPQGPVHTAIVCAGLLRLPDDVLGCINDLLQAPELSHACSRTFQLLGGQYLAFEMPPCMGTMDPVSIVTSLVHRVTLGRALRSLYLGLRGCPVGATGAQAVGALKCARALHTLTLDLVDTDLGDSGVLELVGLKDAAGLEALILNLSSNFIGPQGALALLALAETPRLRSLRLVLKHNHIGAHGAEALAGLGRGTHTLQSLHLDLGGNSLGDAGALGLVALKDSLTLHTVALHLADNHIGDQGAAGLAGLNGARALQCLTLNLHGNHVGPFGARGLAQLRDRPPRHTLNLDVGLKKGGDAGACALGALGATPSLHCLSLNLQNNDVAAAGATGLAQLRQSTRLHTLALHLAWNRISTAGAQALASLKDAAALRWLTVDLGWNGIGPGGVQALASLKDTPRLQRLSLDLVDNQLGDAGVSALVGLQVLPRPPQPTLGGLADSQSPQPPLYSFTTNHHRHRHVGTPISTRPQTHTHDQPLLHTGRKGHGSRHPAHLHCTSSQLSPHHDHSKSGLVSVGWGFGDTEEEGAPQSEIMQTERATPQRTPKL